MVHNTIYKCAYYVIKIKSSGGWLAEVGRKVDGRVGRKVGREINTEVGKEVGREVGRKVGMKTGVGECRRR